MASSTRFTSHDPADAVHAGTARMEYEDNYYGYRIRVVTTGSVDDGWRATAEVADSGEPLFMSDEAHASEDDARRAGLSAAMAEVDRRRAPQGKP